MNRKTLPLLFTLAAGALTIIITFIQKYPLPGMLLAVLIVMAVFYLLGNFIRNMLNYFDRQNAKKAAAEGEVVEKEPDGPEKENAETKKAVTEEET